MIPGHVIDRGDRDRLFEALLASGHTIVGPTVRDQAIVYDEIRAVADPPIGWTDEQDAGDTAHGVESDAVQSSVGELAVRVRGEVRDGRCRSGEGRRAV